MKKIVVALLSFLLTLSLAAQQNQPAPIKLTLKQSIDLAFKNNVALQKQKSSVDLAKMDYWRSVGIFLPNLSASAGISYSNGTRIIDPSLPTVTSENRSYRWGLSSGLNLFRGLSDLKSYQNSQLNLESSKLNLTRSAQNTLLDVSSKYLDVLLKQELLAISKENLVYADEQLKKISEMTRLGSKPLIDLYNQQYQKANSELDVINSEKNLEISKSNLVAALALDPANDYMVEKPDLSQLSSKDAVDNLSVLISSALNNRPDYQVSKLTVQNRENAVWQAWSSYLPSVDASWSWGANANSPATITIADQLTGNRSYSFGINFSLPIFDRFQREYTVQQSNINLRNAKLDLSDLERTITIGVKQAFFDFMSYKKRLEASETQYKAASTLKETAQERYNVGAGSYVELADAIRQYTSAASGLAQARYQYEFQKKVLEFYVGDLKVEDYISIN